MREIKFRAWDKVHNVMCYFNDPEGWWTGLELSTGKIICIIDGKIEDLNSLELMQFTGLTDKNGKEIYEGDIVTDFDDEYDNSSGKLRKQIVHYVTGSYLPVSEHHTSRFKIIGNIHDNKNLLEV